MKQKNFFRLILMLLALYGLSAINVYGQSTNPRWEVPASVDPSQSITVVTEIQIDGVTVTPSADDEIEIGVFAVGSGECRSTAYVLTPETSGAATHVAIFTIYGAPGDHFYYRIYHHGEQKEYVANLPVDEFINDGDVFGLDEDWNFTPISTSVNSSLIAGDGYAFDPVTGTLTVTSNAGATNWRSDVNINADPNARLDAVTTVVFQNGITTIPAGAFVDCILLTNATFSASLTSIGNDAFAECYALNSLTFYGMAAPTLMTGSVFFSAPHNGTLTYQPNATGYVKGSFGYPWLDNSWRFMAAGSTVTSPTITTASLPAGTVGVPYSHTLTATGDAPITWDYFPSGTTPTGGYSLSGDVFSFTQTPTATGTYTIDFEAVNDAGHDVKQLTVTINPAAPTFVAVTGITGVPETMTVGEIFAIEETGVNQRRNLLATVAPAEATNQNIVWSGDFSQFGYFEETTYHVEYVDGNLILVTVVTSYLVAPFPGTFVFTATIKDGLAEGVDYTQDFTINVGIAINATNFPDANFRNYLLGETYGADAVLTDAEIAAITTLDVHGKSIADLTGIGYFTSLITLYCGYNQLTSLPTLPASLKYLNCDSNQLTSLPALPSSLTGLECDRNHLTSLDLSGLTLLFTFYGGGQTVPLTLTGNTTDGYTLTITLNTPTFGNTAVSYSGGTLTSMDNTVASTTFTAQTGNAGKELSGTLNLTYQTVTPAVAPTITTATLPSGTVGTAYSQTLAATGDTPVTWTVDNGSLPGGLTLNGSTGLISGTPSASGTFNFTVKATNNAGNDTKVLSILINPIPEPLQIIAQPYDGEICEGSAFELSVAASGENLQYQWYFGDSPIWGAESSVYRINNASFSDEGYYSVTVYNSGESETSRSAYLNIAERISGPIVINAPEMAYRNESLSLQVGGEGGYDNVYNYIWTFGAPNNDLSIEGSNLYAINVTFHSVTEAQQIRVDIEHVCGTYSATKNIKIDYSTGIVNPSTADVRLYPNPVADILNVDNKQTTIRTIRVNDASGRTVAVVEPKSTNWQLATSAWQPGVYIVSVETDSGISRYKIVKK